MPKRRMIGPCSVIGCGRPIESLTYCHKHYMRQYQFGRLHKVVTGDKRKHPLYVIWWDRKRAGALSEPWLDFDTFVKDVGPQPSKNHFLMRSGAAPFGPNNFQWVEKLRKRSDETNKEWWARKWRARMLANPGIERGRMFRRKYGITVDQYNDMLLKQDGKCAICEQSETSIDGKTGTLRSLAVDHCHNSQKVRGLLCSRCNTTLGKIEESPQLLRAMWDYLHKHLAAEAA